MQGAICKDIKYQICGFALPLLLIVLRPPGLCAISGACDCREEPRDEYQVLTDPEKYLRPMVRARKQIQLPTPPLGER